MASGPRLTIRAESSGHGLVGPSRTDSALFGGRDAEVDSTAIWTGAEHGIDSNGPHSFVEHGNLGLAVRQRPGQRAVLAHVGQLLRHPVGQGDRQRHQHIGFTAGVTEHQALIAGTPGIDPLGDVVGLLVDGDVDRAGIGVESHAGPTPMDRRKDALLGAARIVELVNRIGLDNAPLACSTVGMIEAYPNSRNVIPGRVFLTIDFRHPQDSVLSIMHAALEQGIEQITSDIGLEKELEQIFYYAPVPFDKSCVEAVRHGAEACGYSMREIVAGAGHDSCYLAQTTPTSMIFVPCIDGISHNEIEDARPEWITAGGDTLLHAVLAKAGQAK